MRKESSMPATTPMMIRLEEETAVRLRRLARRKAVEEDRDVSAQDLLRDLVERMLEGDSGEPRGLSAPREG
jgi:predicted transcriptional regulator